MNLRHLTDQCLLADTKQLVKQERELLTVILHHLREIERRRLFGAHPSLHVYAEKELGYSASQAHRRVDRPRGCSPRCPKSNTRLKPVRST